MFIEALENNFLIAKIHAETVKDMKVDIRYNMYKENVETWGI